MSLAKFKAFAEHFLFLDFETASERDISTGGHLYAQQATPLLLGYAIDEGAPQCVKLYAGECIPLEVMELLQDPSCKLVAFNCDFERLIFKYCFPNIRVDYSRWFDVMLQAREHGLAGSLNEVAMVFGFSKLASGKAQLLKFIKTQAKAKEFDVQAMRGALALELAVWTFNTAQAEAQRSEAFGLVEDLVEYCKTDVLVTRECMYRLPLGNYPANKFELKLAAVTAEMNDRGLPIDMVLVKRILAVADIAKTLVSQALVELTSGAVKSVYEYGRASVYLHERHGVAAGSSVSASNIRVLKDTALEYREPEALVAFCELWLSGGTAVSKFTALLNTVDPATSRCYGTLAFCAASRTKRWGGRQFQPHNLKRPSMSPEELSTAIHRVLTEPAEVVGASYSLDALGDMVRASICAPDEMLLAVADLSAIEQRSLMWLVNDTRALDLYKQADAGCSSYDLYQLTYAAAFGVLDPSTVQPDQRFVGKVMSLLLQYKGGTLGLMNGIKNSGADLEQFVDLVLRNSTQEEINAATVEFSNLTDEQRSQHSACQYPALAIARDKWRIANPKVVQFGARLEACFIAAVRNPGFTYKAFNAEHEEHKAIRFTYNAEYKFLKLAMPIGAMYYAMPDISGTGMDRITVCQASVKVPRASYYAGKFLENVASGLSREIIAHGILRAHDAGLSLLTMVHDEVVAEVPADEAELKLEQLISCMTSPISGLAEFPLAAKGFVSKRYRK